jgi:hypothetical protein
MKVEIETRMNGCMVFIWPSVKGIVASNLEPYCCEEVKFGKNYETRLRATVDKLLEKAKIAEELKDEQHLITKKIQKEYE